MKLDFELVPRPCWGENLRKRLKQSVWDKIRKAVYIKNNGSCAICGDVSSILHCHEVWDYAIVNGKGIQKLIDLIPICKMCHHVKHIGQASILSNKGELDMNEVIDHFIRVNQCSRSVFEREKKKAFEVWEKRNSYEWETLTTEWEKLVQL